MSLVVLRSLVVLTVSVVLMALAMPGAPVVTATPGALVKRPGRAGGAGGTGEPEVLAASLAPLATLVLLGLSLVVLTVPGVLVTLTMLDASFGGL